ncbi:MAG: GNAT family N-acetyltransferase [Cyanophyceae cyanobacterium]
MAQTDVLIRQARLEDVERVTILCHQLGYSTSTQDVQTYIKTLAAHRCIVYVACHSDRPVVGLINVYVANELLLSKQAEIGALIVDEAYRSGGIGRLLVQHGQQWAKEQGCHVLQVRANVIRDSAHAFYKRIGCELYKSQRVFRKPLA